MASPTSHAMRLVLRAGLLAGALLDSALVLALLAAARGLGTAGGSAIETVSYSWLLWPALAARAGVQAFACYDLRRYDQAIPWLALTLVASGFAAWLGGEIGPGPVAAFGLLGAIQLIAWRRSR